VTATERVTSVCPFTIRRRVRFGDCDPAGVVYTVRFSDYAVSAMELFLAELLGGPHLVQLAGIHTPIKALSFVFSAPMRPNDEFDMRVTVPNIRTRTFDLAITATLASGTPAFEVLLTPITIDAERRSVPIPDILRALLTAYQQRSGAVNATTLPR
jgi:acyl-CoA thioesterase FadM